MQKPIPFFRGDTLRLPVRVVSSETREPVNLTGYRVEAAVETPHGARVYNFTVAAPDATGLVILTAAPAVTSAWPEGPLLCAVRLFSPAGDLVTSPSWSISSDRSLFE